MSGAAPFSFHFDSFPTTRDLEQLHLNEALALANGDRNLTAAYLGVSRKTIDNRIKAGNQK